VHQFDPSVLRKFLLEAQREGKAKIYAGIGEGRDEVRRSGRKDIEAVEGTTGWAEFSGRTPGW